MDHSLNHYQVSVNRVFGALNNDKWKALMVLNFEGIFDAFNDLTFVDKALPRTK